MWEMCAVKGSKLEFWPGDVTSLKLKHFKEKTHIVSQEENGWKDFEYFVSDLEGSLNLTFVGKENIQKEQYLTFFADPIFHIGFYGAKGFINATRILNELAGVFSIPGVIFSRSITVRDYANLTREKEFHERIKEEQYVYQKTDFSPQSFTNNRYEKEGKAIQNSSFFAIILGFDENEKEIFSPKEHWLASTFCQTYPDHAEFGVGCALYNQICCKDHCKTLFSTNGREDMEVMYLRPVISINAKYIGFYLEIEGLGLTGAMQILAEGNGF